VATEAAGLFTPPSGATDQTEKEMSRFDPNVDIFASSEARLTDNKRERGDEDDAHADFEPLNTKVTPVFKTP